MDDDWNYDLQEAINQNELDRATTIVTNATGEEKQNLLSQGLYIGSRGNRLDVVQHFLALRADSKKFGKRSPPLIIAVRSQNVDLVRLLLESEGRDVVEPAKLSLRRSAVTLAQSKEMAELLIQYLPNIDSALKEGRTLLMDMRKSYITQLLLSAGASTEAKDPDGQTALMISLTEDEDPAIAKLLIERGARIDAVDNYGRTILMTAIWKSRIDIVKLLIERGVDVKATDKRRRNALHHLASDKDRVYQYRPDARGGKNKSLQERDQHIVKMLLNAGIDPNARDDHKRTCVHWASKIGCDGLMHILLATRKFDLELRDRRSKTALHLAAESQKQPHKDFSMQHKALKKESKEEFQKRKEIATVAAVAHRRTHIIQMLLRAGAYVHAESDGLWTPLHLACFNTLDWAPMVKVLLDKGKNLDCRTTSGRTPLHIASRAGNEEIVRFLLQQDGIMRTAIDIFGNTALLCAAHCNTKSRTKVIELLAPWNNAHLLSRDAKRAAELTEATIVDFGPGFEGGNIGSNGNLLKRISVYDLLYNDQVKGEASSSTSPISKPNPKNFRWIHLPANTGAWCLDLIAKHFIETDIVDTNSLKHLEKSFNHEHLGWHPQSRYMSPLCTTILRSLASEDLQSNADEELDDHTNLYDGRRRTQAGSSIVLTQQQSSTSQYLTADNQDEILRDPKPLQRSSSNDDRNPSQGLISDFYLFMPYLHFETCEQFKEMLKTYRSQDPGFGRSGTFDSTRNMRLGDNTSVDDGAGPEKERALFRAHFLGKQNSLHLRRTLDQFFYHNIDTSERDRDRGQVIHRYQKILQREKDEAKQKLLFVDQLWLWNIGEKVLITSFPQRWNQPKKDRFNVFDSILEDINSGSREPLRSIYELAMIVSGRCYGVFDRHSVGSYDTQVLEMFDSWIGAAMDDEVKLFKRFKEASAEASRQIWDPQKEKRLPKIRPKPKFTVIERENAPREEDDFVKSLLDVGWETELLDEIKDVQDELDMLSLLFQYQEQVRLSVKDAIESIFIQGSSAVKQKIQKAFSEHERTVSHPQREIERMKKQAKRMYNSIRDLLDLKQKHANGIEARYAREQTEDTSRQGVTLMVFTTVTVIFLPLSFIAAFFAINIEELPHDGKGDQIMTIGFISKFVFGIGFSVACLCVILALFARSILEFIKGACQKLRHSRSQKRFRKEEQRREADDEARHIDSKNLAMSSSSSDHSNGRPQMRQSSKGSLGRSPERPPDG